MQVISEIQALRMINEIMRIYDTMPDEMIAKGRFKAEVDDVRFTDLVKLFYRIPPGKARIYMPGEVGTETMVILYDVVPGFTITIQSEQCVKLIPKINTIILN